MSARTIPLVLLLATTPVFLAQEECPPPEEIDNDYDGFTELEGDCNDSNPMVYPGAPEYCGDGLDNNCDGDVDVLLPEQTWTYDFDEDGFGPIEPEIWWVLTCTPQPGSLATTTKLGDCDDSDASINPEAEELCDGVDQDCDNHIDEACN